MGSTKGINTIFSGFDVYSITSFVPPGLAGSLPGSPGFRKSFAVKL